MHVCVENHVNSSLEVVNQQTTSAEDQRSRDDRWLNVWAQMARVHLHIIVNVRPMAVVRAALDECESSP